MPPKQPQSHSHSVSSASAPKRDTLFPKASLKKFIINSGVERSNDGVISSIDHYIEEELAKIIIPELIEALKQEEKKVKPDKKTITVTGEMIKRIIYSRGINIPSLSAFRPAPAPSSVPAVDATMNGIPDDKGDEHKIPSTKHSTSSAGKKSSSSASTSATKSSKTPRGKTPAKKPLKSALKSSGSKGGKSVRVDISSLDKDSSKYAHDVLNATLELQPSIFKKIIQEQIEIRFKEYKVRYESDVFRLIQIYIEQMISSLITKAKDVCKFAGTVTLTEQHLTFAYGTLSRPIFV